jgi:hypothetical protein
MTKQQIDLTSGQPLLDTLVEGKSTMSDAYRVSVQADNAMNKIRGATAGVFSVLRYEVVQLFSKELSDKGSVDKMDIASIVQDFVAQCAIAENSYQDVSDKNLCRTWINAKSQLKAALEKGYNFYDNQTAGQSAIQKWTKDLKEATEKAEREAAIQAHAAKHGTNVHVLETGTKQVDIENSQGQAEQKAPSAHAPALPESSPLDDDIKELVSLLQELAAADSSKAQTMINHYKGECALAARKALAKLAKVG